MYEEQKQIVVKGTTEVEEMMGVAADELYEDKKNLIKNYTKSRIERTEHLLTVIRSSFEEIQKINEDILSLRSKSVIEAYDEIISKPTYFYLQYPINNEIC